MSLLRRGIISSGKLDAGGGPTTYATNSAYMPADTSKYYSGGTPSAFNIFLGSNPYTISFWWKPRSTSGSTANLAIFNGAVGSSFNTGRELNKVTFNRIEHSPNAFTTLKSDTSIVAGTWYHIVCSYDGTDMGMRIDRGTEKTLVSTLSPTVNSDLRIGGNYSGASSVSNPDDSEMAFIQFYNRYLTTSELNQMVNGSGDPLCFADIPTSITDDCVYAPRFCNWSTNAGQELTDQSVSGITTTNVGSIGYTGTGLTVEC